MVMGFSLDPRTETYRPAESFLNLRNFFGACPFSPGFCQEKAFFGGEIWDAS